MYLTHSLSVLFFAVVFGFFVCFLRYSFSLIQADLELTIEPMLVLIHGDLLRWPPTDWNYKCDPLYPAVFSL